ncbi:MAG: hypothetical protein IJH00_03305 [Erysipelotrichaceae bacterium]|nr:hypothetical protein [Erysipelotrichaceae bacterium]MBQ6493144.1 hypothetical protein [Erysipelotrichaceae bacterium]
MYNKGKISSKQIKGENDMIKIEMTMRSAVLDMDCKLEMLLPENRKKTEDLRGKKYPVLYVLHGMKDDCSSWIDMSNIKLVCRDLDLIVVFPSVTNSSYADMKYGYDYYTYVTEELPLKLKNYFPISDRREDTFIMGESMGGYGTLKIALNNPDKYAKAVCLSGPNIVDFLDYDSKVTKANFGSREEVEGSHNDLCKVVDDLKAYGGELPELAFYCGTEDFVYEGCRKMADYVKENLPAMRVEEGYWKGEHNFFFWNEAVPKALQFFGFEVKGNSII